jgi:hypothetical protein
MSKNKINFKINFITKLKFKIVIIVKRKLGNPVLINKIFTKNYN